MQANELTGMTDDFRQRTISSVGWSSVSQIGVQALTLLIGIILARLLTPRDFGLVGMVSVLVNFAYIFGDLGLGAALIHKQEAKLEHYSSVFWVNVCVGILMTLVFMAGAPWVGRFYNEPTLVPLTMLISLNFVVGSLATVHIKLFEKQLSFKYLAITNAVSACLSGAAAIGMALLGFGVWSLAAMPVIATITLVTLVWYIGDWRPRFLFDWGALKELLGFSSNLLGFTIFSYWARNADKLLIGRVLGSISLGLYNKAYSIMLLPLTNISSVIGRVMFPALSSIQEDRLLTTNVYLRAARDIALISFPMMAGLWAISEPFVIAVFGSHWSGMIPLLRAFCPVAMIQSIVTLNGAIYTSQGRTDLQLKVGGTLGVLRVIAIIIGLKWGVKGVAYSYCLFTFFGVWPSLAILGSLVGLSLLQIIRNLCGVLCCAMVMATVVWLVGLAIPNEWGYWAHLVVRIPVGFLVYISLAHLFKLQAYCETRELLKEQWGQRVSSTRVAQS